MARQLYEGVHPSAALLCRSNTPADGPDASAARGRYAKMMIEKGKRERARGLSQSLRRTPLFPEITFAARPLMRWIVAAKPDS